MRGKKAVSARKKPFTGYPLPVGVDLSSVIAFLLSKLQVCQQQHLLLIEETFNEQIHHLNCNSVNHMRLAIR
jgi:hypothetical protein